MYSVLVKVSQDIYEFIAFYYNYSYLKTGEIETLLK